jgi:hypothetical protein
MGEVNMLSGETAELLSLACDLDKQKKKIDKELAEIKDKLKNELEPGKYTNPTGDTLTLSESVSYTEIEPKALLKELRKLKLEAKFPDCIKVQTAPTLKLLGEVTVNKLRSINGTTLRFTFK